MNKLFHFRSVYWFLLLLGITGCYLGGNHPPQLIKKSIVVIYPPEARAKRIEGRVEVSILIDKTGHVKQAQIAKTSGYPILDNAALQIAQLARFKPARLHGKKQAVWVVWPLVFKIRQQKLDPKSWQREVLGLKNRIKKAREAGQQQLIEDLFFRYKEFAEYLVDHPDKKYNQQIQAVVAKKIVARWKEFWDVYPAAFALFDDFVAEFPKHEFAPEAHLYLEQYLEFALKDLKSPSNHSALPSSLRNEMIVHLSAYLQMLKSED